MADERPGWYPSFFGCVQVPELDVSVSRGDEVAVVLRERDGENSAGDFVGGDDRTFLLADTKTGRQKSFQCPNCYIDASVPVFYDIY